MTVSNILFSCADAQPTISNINAFCSSLFIDPTRLFASAYVAANFSIYNPSQPLSRQYLNTIAENMYDELLLTSKHNSNKFCKDFIKSYSCLSVFPNCPTSGSGYAYLDVCRFQCQQVDHVCKIEESLGCNNLPIEGCSVHIQPGFLMLSLSEGPYESLPTLYIIMCALWFAGLIVWSYLTYIKYANRCLLLCRYLVFVPMIKLTSLSFAFAFWITYNQLMVGTYWISITYLNFHLIYELTLIVGFLFIAKGWTLTRPTIDGNEWRIMIIAATAFYLANSMILVLEGEITTLINPVYWIIIGVIYGTMYLSIFITLRYELIKVHTIVRELKENMPNRLQSPLRYKKLMLDTFLVLVFISFCSEVLLHALVALKYSYFIILLFYEITNLVVVAGIGWMFRPQEFSPFFFMTLSRHDARNRAIPVVEVEEDPSDTTDDNNGDDDNNDDDGNGGGDGMHRMYGVCDSTDRYDAVEYNQYTAVGDPATPTTPQLISPANNVSRSSSRRSSRSHVSFGLPNLFFSGTQKVSPVPSPSSAAAAGAVAGGTGMGPSTHLYEVELAPLLEMDEEHMPTTADTAAPDWRLAVVHRPGSSSSQCASIGLHAAASDHE